MSAITLQPICNRVSVPSIRKPQWTTCLFLPAVSGENTGRRAHRRDDRCCCGLSPSPTGFPIVPAPLSTCQRQVRFNLARLPIGSKDLLIYQHRRQKQRVPEGKSRQLPAPGWLSQWVPTPSVPSAHRRPFVCCRIGRKLACFFEKRPFRSPCGFSPRDLRAETRSSQRLRPGESGSRSTGASLEIF